MPKFRVKGLKKEPGIPGPGALGKVRQLTSEQIKNRLLRKAIKKGLHHTMPYKTSDDDLIRAYLNNLEGVKKAIRKK